MTLIIGVESPEEECAYVLTDSGAWMNNVREVLVTPKIWRDGDWLVGGAGELAQVSVARLHALPVCSHDDSTADIEAGLGIWHRDLIGHWAIYAQSLVTILGSQGQSSNIPTFICALGSRVFDVTGGTASRCIRGYEAVGILRQYTLGALRALSLRSKNPFDLAREAMQCAYADSDYVWGPVRWASTKAKEIGVFDATTAQMLNQLWDAPTDQQPDAR